MLNNHTHNIILNCIFLKTTLICILPKLLCIQVFKITLEMSLNDPYTKKQQIKYKPVADRSYFLIWFFFVVGKHNSNWCILNLDWSTVPWRKKNSLTCAHFFKVVLVHLMDIFMVLLNSTHSLVLLISLHLK